jgi:uncharacterized cupin superfamily protein
MMEPHPGVFVSTVRTEEWEPDPEVPGSEMHELVHADGVWAGLTRFTSVDGPSPWTPSQRETIHVLQGEVAIEIAGGPTLMLKPGDLASLPAALRRSGTSPRHLPSCGCSPDRLLAGYRTARSTSWLNAPFLSAPRRGARRQTRPIGG